MSTRNKRIYYQVQVSDGFTFKPCGKLRIRLDQAQQLAETMVKAFRFVRLMEITVTRGTKTKPVPMEQRKMIWRYP